MPTNRTGTALASGARTATQTSEVFVNNEHKGIVVYLNVTDQMQAVLDRIEPAGGKIAMPPTDIGFGFIAFFLDTEGNKVGLHSEN